MYSNGKDLWRICGTVAFKSEMKGRGEAIYLRSRKTVVQSYNSKDKTVEIGCNTNVTKSDYEEQESRAAARKPRDAEAEGILFDLKFANDIHFQIKCRRIV